MAVSPRTQEMMQPPPSGEDAQRAFEDGFTQMAQNVMVSKYPDLMEQVVTFKVVDADLETNSGVGAFILSRNGETVHIPVVLANNQIKPLETMYIPSKDIYLPLQRPWLEEIDRENMGVMGQSVEPPKTMPRDVSVQNLVVPPLTGRFSYASGEKLAQFLNDAPNHVKSAFREVLKTHPKVLKFAHAHLELDTLIAASAPVQEKVAAFEPQVRIIDVNAGAKAFKEVFGKQAAAAFQEATKKGYAVKDERRFYKLAVEIESSISLHEAKEPGFYRLQLTDGRKMDTLIVPNPQPLVSADMHGKTTGTAQAETEGKRRKQDSEDVRATLPRKTRYLVIAADHQSAILREPPVGKKLPEEEVDTKLLKMLSEKGTPATNSYGVFVRYEAGKASATDPVDINKVSTGSDGVRRYETGVLTEGGPRTIVSDPKSAIRQIVAPKTGRSTYVPTTYKFVRLEHGNPNRYARSADEQIRSKDMLSKVGAAQLRVIDAHSGMFSIMGMQPINKLAAVTVLVHGAHLRADDAERVLEKAATVGHHDFYAVNPAQLQKLAQGMDPTMSAPPPQAAPPMGGMPPPPSAGAPPPPAGGEMPMDPTMAPPMDPAMMAPPPPPPPDPVQIAVTEISSQLAEQASQVAQQLAEQERDLSNQLQILNAVQQRALQVSEEQMGGGMEPPIGAPPGAAGPPVGAETGQAGAAGPPVGAQTEPLPPGAPMPVETGQAGEMMNQAADLGEPEAFEATAIGSLAANEDLQSVVANYLPTLEQALDHLSRILLSLWIQESTLRTELGEETFIELEEKLRNVLNNLGGLVLKINQATMAAKPEDEMVT